MIDTLGLMGTGIDSTFQNWRISFFLFLCFAMFAPMIQLFYEQGMRQGNRFVGA